MYPAFHTPPPYSPCSFPTWHGVTAASTLSPRPRQQKFRQWLRRDAQRRFQFLSLANHIFFFALSSSASSVLPRLLSCYCNSPLAAVLQYGRKLFSGSCIISRPRKIRGSVALTVLLPASLAKCQSLARSNTPFLQSSQGLTGSDLSICPPLYLSVMIAF